MRHVRTPRLEPLEGRQLLSHARPAALHRAAHVASATPISLDGTLAVDNAKSGTSTSYNMDGSTTTSVVVMGSLAGVGPVQGTWSQSVDSNGMTLGPDALRLRGAGGTLIIALNDTNPARPIRAGHGAAFTEYSQVLVSGAGAYAGTAERGSIELFAQHAGGPVTSLILHSKGA